MKALKIKINDLGKVDYDHGISIQKNIHELSENEATILILEHNKVITVGRRGSEKDILIPLDQIEKKGFRVIKTDRGGQVTIHNEGQLVCYLILPLSEFNLKPVDLIRKIEKLIINLLKNFDISSFTIKGKTGVWVKNNDIEKKIAAIGVRISNGVSMHGFALNVDNDLKDFDLIIPCGIQDSIVTSIAKESSVKLENSIIKSKLKDEIEKIFNCEVINE
ncbi:MAG: octanoyltransferase [Chloroflexi bacterium]|nr:octanoyltransferase [Chloroflexota bacterium]